MTTPVIMVNKVDKYIEKHAQWKKELELLRSFLDETELEEDYKWSLPVYTLNGKNIVGIGATKSYIGLWFFQGALLTDPDKVLVNAQKDKTQAMRQWRMKSVTPKDKKRILPYIAEAIQNQREGREIKPQRNKPLIVPDILEEALVDNGLKEAFDQLGLGKRREFAEHIASAKKEETRQRRLDKILPMIRNGVGLNDKYVK